MSANKISSFISTTLAEPQSQWLYSKISEISGLAVPDAIVGIREDLLRSDVYSLWARWFMEAICDPQRFVNSKYRYADIFKAVIDEISRVFTSYPYDERVNFGKELARLVDAEVTRRRNKERGQIDLKTRRFLVDISSPIPYCWICGYRFSKEAIDRFLKLENTNPSLPQFVDYLKPHGLFERDMTIEADHVLPVAEGGNEDDNLRLACGWCNAAKGARVLIYDVGAKPFTAFHPIVGALTLPRSFWVVRTLAIRQRCEHSNCGKTPRDTQLTVMPIHSKGAMNPTNLFVTCTEHDSIPSFRLVSRDAAKEMWKKGASEE